MSHTLRCGIVVKITDGTHRDMGSKPLSGKIVLTVILLLAGPGPDSEYGLPRQTRRHRDSHAKVNRNPSQDHGWLRAGSSEQALADMLFPSQPGK